jgi:RNA-directed DNA polymerase
MVGRKQNRAASAAVEFLMTEPFCEQIRQGFAALRTRADVATLLGLTDRALRYRFYALSTTSQYQIFKIKKRSGGFRIIAAPEGPLKYIQHRLHRVLECIYEPKAAVHGFTAGCSIKSNAKEHLRTKWVLNVDISEFFPSINFGRVRGMFMANPYNCTPQVATILAQICCVNNQLPQGSPTSPIVSNMICARLDAHMNRLAASAKCRYTRYADDMTLSTFQTRFPKDIAEIKLVEGETKCVPGPRLVRVVRRNGFELNHSKIRLSSPSQRQEVTGLVVNEKVNVTREFIREVRAMLHNLRKVEIEECQRIYESKYSSKRHRSPSSRVPLFLWVLQGKLDYIGMIRGKEDWIYRSFLKQLAEMVPSIDVPVIKDEIDKLFEHVWVVNLEDAEGYPRQGTAFVLRGTGLVTASHVLGKGKFQKLTISSSDGSNVFDARVLKRDGTLDLAILEAPKMPVDGGLERSRLEPRRKMPITVLGFPNHNVGESGRFDEGIITGFKPNPFGGKDLFLINRQIITGQSGGPILDAASKVIGVVQRGGRDNEEAAATDFHAGIPISILSDLI